MTHNAKAIEQRKQTMIKKYGSYENWLKELRKIGFVGGSRSKRGKAKNKRVDKE